MTTTVAETRLTDLLSRFDDTEAGELLGLNPTALDRRRQGDGWTVVEAVKIGAACRVRFSDLFD